MLIVQRKKTYLDKKKGGRARRLHPLPPLVFTSVSTALDSILELKYFLNFPLSPNFNVASGWKSVPIEITSHSTTLQSGERSLFLKKIGIYSKIIKILESSKYFMTEDADFRICSMVKTENPEVNRKLSKSKNNLR